MQLSSDDFFETVESARDYLRTGCINGSSLENYARALVQAADTCLVGVACEKHGGETHGGEAEELRAGVEHLLKSIGSVRDDEAAFVLGETRRALIFLLDRIDARDSLSFREATDEDAEDDSDDGGTKADDAASPTDEDEAYRARCAKRRAFFAARSVGDKVSWGIRRSGVIQKIEEEYVTIRDDGWPADPPLVVYTPPFVERFRIDYMLNLALVEEAPKG